MSAILTCTDGSLYAPSIYQHAAWVAEKCGASVHVLHVIERDEFHQPADFTGSLGFDASGELLEELVEFDETHARVARLRGTAILEDARRQLLAAGVASVATTQRHGSLVETLDEFEKEASLVVIGKRGEHADFARGHLGSNLERVVRSVQIPVLVAARAFHPIERFLLAFDGGPSALKAVHYAATEPLLRGAEAHLVGVGKAGSDLEREMEKAATELRGAGLKVHQAFRQGHADAIIAQEVRDRKIDLLLMGAYGHSHIRHLVIGSTTSSLIRTCTVPVLLFR